MLLNLRKFLKISRESGLVPAIEAVGNHVLQVFKLRQAGARPSFIVSAIEEVGRYVLWLLKLYQEKQLRNYEVSQEFRFLEKIDPKKLLGSDKKRKITWIMPTFIKATGGHQTIFRFAKYFELRGYCNTFVICNYGQTSAAMGDQFEELLKKKIFQYFYASLSCSVSFYDSDVALLERIEEIDTDIVIGTDMKSQLIAMNVAKANRRLSFLQDDEPRFQPAGSISAFISAHYSREGTEFVCAGQWLASLLTVKQKHTFILGVDSLKALVLRQTFKRPNQQSSKIKIAVYSRNTTERRCVELAWSYLDGLHQLGEEFEVHSFGQDRKDWAFPYPVVNHGVLSSTAMYRLLLECDICIAFSATNYSLLPNEAVSVGAIAVDLDTPSNRMVYRNDGVKLIGPEVPKAITQLREIMYQCRNSMVPHREMDLNRAYERDLCWETQQNAVYNDLFGDHQPDLMEVSVCIPTMNAGPLFEILLFALQKQALVEIELCIIDTESNDETLDLVYKYFPEAKVHRVTKAEFGHGKTRNRLAEMASHEHILFLTQDAIPLDELLVISLLMHVVKDSRICGSFCSHVAYPSHPLFLAHSIEKQFRVMADSFSVKNFAKNEKDCLRYRFFSSNCALVKRSLLLSHPFEDVLYGEDQIWAAQMLREGFGTAFVPDVSIMHSHNYDGDDLVARTRTDLEFHKIHFGEFPHWSKKRLDKRTDRVAAEIGASPQEIADEKRRNALKMQAYELAKTSKRVTYKT